MSLVALWSSMLDMTPTEIIDALGGTTHVAKLCEVTEGAVSQWRRNGIPNARLMYLRLARPDVFRPSKIARKERIAA